MAVANTEVSCRKGQRGQTRSQDKRTCGDLVMREEQDLGVEVFHEWFTHGGNSISSAFSGEPLQENLQGN